MAYTKQVWYDKPVTDTPLSAARLSHIEDGVEAAASTADAASTAAGTKQPLDSDLTAIAGLAPSNDDVMQRKAGAWTNRTVSQLKTDLSLNAVDNVPDSSKPVSTAQQTALNLKLNANDASVTNTRTPTDNTVGTAKIIDANVTLAKLSGSVQTSLGKADTAYQAPAVVAAGVDAAAARAVISTMSASEIASAISTAVGNLLNGAPGALDTLKELADAINDDASFAASVTTALNARALASRTVNGHALTADVTVTKADVGLGSNDNVSDANKPVSTLQQAALDLKAPLASPTFTGTVAGISKSMVGLGNNDNTSDVNKPISTAQAAGLAPSRIGYGVVALGDSMTANYGDGNQLRQMEGPLSRACAEAGQNPLFRGTFATGGYTLAQILSTHVPTVVALSPKPWAAVILGGTNDAGASSGVGFSVSTAIGTLTSICNALRAVNIQPILATLPPRSDTSLVNQNVANYNRALWRFAVASGYDVVDYNQVVVNPGTGGFLTGLAQSDNVHPDFKAVKIMGQALTKVFDGMQKPSVAPTRATHSLDPTNLLGAQGHFQVDTNADGIADGFSNAVPRGATFTVVSDPDGVTKWQRITQPSSATGNNLLQKSIASVVAAGETIEAVCRVQTSGFDAALVAPSGLTGGTGPQFAFTVGLTGASHDLEPIYNWHTDVNDVLVYLRGVVPSGATGGITINLQAVGVPVSGSVWMQFTEVCVRNLTTLGLV